MPEKYFFFMVIFTVVENVFNHCKVDVGCYRTMTYLLGCESPLLMLFIINVSLIISSSLLKMLQRQCGISNLLLVVTIASKVVQKCSIVFSSDICETHLYTSCFCFVYILFSIPTDVRCTNFR